MSNREKWFSILDTFSEAQLVNIAVMLQAARDTISEAANDAFCHGPYEVYQADPDRGQSISLEAAARQLGADL